MVKKASSLSALGGLVYSTDGGRHCPDCQHPKDACICGQAVAPVGDGIARVRRETKGRGGKTVTTISGLPLAGDALNAAGAWFQGLLWTMVSPSPVPTYRSPAKRSADGFGFGFAASHRSSSLCTTAHATAC